MISVGDHCSGAGRLRSLAGVAPLSLRVEGDYVYNTFFSEHQNDFQGVTGVGFHF